MRSVAGRCRSSCATEQWCSQSGLLPGVLLCCRYTGEGREFLRFNTAWLNLLREFHFLHALFRALKCDYGLTSALYAEAGLALLCAHVAKRPGKGRKNSRVVRTGP